MTGMLASVTNITEARIVLDESVDIIDIKNPHEGALGALELSGVKDIVRYVNNAIPTSATIGDVSPDDPELSRYIMDMANTGVDYVKVGLFDTRPSDYFIQTVHEAAQEISLVIVVFAENYSGKDSIKPLLQSGITGIMLDTKDKTGKNLCSLLNEETLKEFIETAKKYNLLTGLAGSLRFEDIQPLLDLKPDYLGFRGALCSENDRVNTINKVQVKKIRAAVPFSKLFNYDDRSYVKAKWEVTNGTMA